MMVRILSTVLLLALCSVCSLAQELPRRPFLGVSVHPLDDAARRNAGIPSDGGVLIQTVFDNSSAGAAGLQKDDIITAVGGKPVQNTQHFLSLLGSYATGDKVEFTLYRNGDRLTRTVVMKPRPQEQYPGVEVSYGQVQSGENLLRTIFTRPTGASGALPVLYLIQGIDCGSVDQPFSNDHTFGRFVEYFSARGYATYRVEKSGVGDSRGTPCPEMDFLTETQGFLDGLKHLKRMNGIDTDNIYIVGLSLGGLTAPMIASQEPVKGMVVYGTALRPWSEYMLENTRRQSVLSGDDYPDIEARTKDLAQTLHYMFAERKSPAEIAQAHPDLADDIAYLTYGSPADRPEFIVGRHYNFIRQVYEVNLSQYWKNTAADVLVVWGRGDFVSDPDDHRMIVDLVNNYRPGRATYAEINADHWFGTAATTRESFRNMAAHKQPVFSEEILPLIDNWLRDIN